MPLTERETIAALDPETHGHTDTRPRWPQGENASRTVTLTLQAIPVRAATPSALRHRALCNCWRCWAN